MKIKSITASAILAVWAAGLFAACDPNNSPSAGNFDRAAMLRNYADNLIKPAFTDLQTRTNALQAAASTFSGEPTAPNLTALQTAWETAFTAFQNANAYNFGPGGRQGTREELVNEMATFPASTDKIEAAIAANNASLNENDFNRDARGFLALDYLLFDGDNAVVLAKLQASATRRAYALAVANLLKTQADRVAAAWNGTYAAEFVANNGTGAGSSTALFYNSFVASYEAIKNFKLAVPLGNRPGQTQTEPMRVEAYYSGKSLPMLKVHLAAIENIWRGRSKDGQGGIGFREYLESVQGGPELIAATETQLTAIRTAQDAIPTNRPLSQLIQTDRTPVQNFYNELQKNTRNFKSEMSSKLGISITFQSGDGD